MRTVLFLKLRRETLILVEKVVGHSVAELEMLWSFSLSIYYLFVYLANLYCALTVVCVYVFNDGLSDNTTVHAVVLSALYVWKQPPLSGDIELCFSPFRVPHRQWGCPPQRRAQGRQHVAWSQPAILLPLEPCRWSPVLIPRISPQRLTFFGLMMIDYGGFFITLNLISACSNLSNDCSLLAIVKFKSFFI